MLDDKLKSTNYSIDDKMLTTMDNLDFADWLSQELKARNMTQAELARLSGVYRQVISTYINRKRSTPEPEILTAIARAFKLPPEDVFRAAGILPPATDPTHTPSLGEWMKLFADADPETREQLLAMARALASVKHKK